MEAPAAPPLPPLPSPGAPPPLPPPSAAPNAPLPDARPWPVAPPEAGAPPRPPPRAEAGAGEVPLAAIKRLIAGETGEHKVGADALHVIQHAVELFLERLTAAAVAKGGGGRAGLEYDAIAAAVLDESTPEFAFLADMVPPTTTWGALHASDA